MSGPENTLPGWAKGTIHDPEAREARAREGVIRAAIEKKAIEVEPRRINPEDFKGREIYHLGVKNDGTQYRSKATVPNFKKELKDIVEPQAYAELKRRNYESAQTPEEKERKAIADVAEAVLFEVLPIIFEDEGIQVMEPPSEADDLFNGADAVVLFRGPRGAIEQVMSIDFFYSGGDEQEARAYASQKMGYTARVLHDNERLSYVNFIQSQWKDRKEDFLSASNVPHVMLGISEENVRACAKSWVEGEPLISEKEKSTTRRIILDSFYVQLTAQLAFAESHNEQLSAQGPLKNILAKIQTLRDTLPEVPGKPLDTALRAVAEVSTKEGLETSLLSAWEGYAQRGIDEELEAEGVLDRRLEKLTQRETELKEKIEMLRQRISELKGILTPQVV